MFFHIHCLPKRAEWTISHTLNNRFKFSVILFQHSSFVKCERARAQSMLFSSLSLSLHLHLYVYVTCNRDVFAFSRVLVNSMFFAAQNPTHSVFAEKKGNCNVERVKKHNHKNNNNKTLNNFEILCQQTWLNRLCHTFDANEWLQWQWRCVCIVHFIEVQIALNRFGRSLARSRACWLAGWLTKCMRIRMSCEYVFAHFSFLRMRKKRLSAERATAGEQWFVFHWLVIC